MPLSPALPAVDREGPTGAPTLVLLHAGVADRRMWDPVWPDLVRDHDVVRLDLRGFGEAVTVPEGPVSHRGDVLEVLDALGVGRCHLVGASLGSGIAAEVAVERPTSSPRWCSPRPGAASW